MTSRVNSLNTGSVPNTGYRPLKTMISHLRPLAALHADGPLCGLWPNDKLIVQKLLIACFHPNALAFFSLFRGLKIEIDRVNELNSGSVLNTGNVA